MLPRSGPRNHDIIYCPLETRNKFAIFSLLPSGSPFNNIWMDNMHIAKMILYTFDWNIDVPWKNV